MTFWLGIEFIIVGDGKVNFESGKGLTRLLAL